MGGWPAAAVAYRYAQQGAKAAAGSAETATRQITGSPTAAEYGSWGVGSPARAAGRDNAAVYGVWVNHCCMGATTALVPQHMLRQSGHPTGECSGAGADQGVRQMLCCKVLWEGLPGSGLEQLPQACLQGVQGC